MSGSLNPDDWATVDLREAWPRPLPPLGNVLMPDALCSTNHRPKSSPAPGVVMTNKQDGQPTRP
jgi:hypothetical protein